MDPPPAIAFAVPGDAPTLAALSRDRIETGLLWRYTPRRLAALIADPETVAIVARRRDAIAGFGVMTFADERSHLVLLAVDAAHERSGIGRALLDWLVQSAFAAGVASIHVELRAGNVAAYALYRVSGFVETLRIPGYYQGREDAVKMMRLLRHPAQRPRTHYVPPPRSSERH